jgi:hypothetical protein
LCESVETGHIDLINQTEVPTSTIHENDFLKGMARFWDAFASTASESEVGQSNDHGNSTSQVNSDNPVPISPNIIDNLNLPISNEYQEHPLASENNIHQHNDVDSEPDEPPQQSG